MAAIGPLVIVFVFVLPLFRHSLAGIAAVFGLYLVTVLGLMAFALRRLIAWRRANPWTPPS
jgi:predicted ABC-type exoprotein transport system permease subunit